LLDRLRTSIQHARTALILAVPLVLALPGCRGTPRGTDLLQESLLVDAKLTSGRDLAWVRGQMGRPYRINDVVLRSIPAAPPSTLRFRADVPARAHLTLACGIPPDHHGGTPVEFVASVLRGGRAETVWTQLLDPLNKPAHRRWVYADADLSRFAGQGVELVLETRGYEPSDDARRALWALPAIATTGSDAPLAIVYLVDTLRADHTQPYGYGRDTTPELVRFAADGVVFEQAISHAAWTKPAVGSVLTSLLPGRHRAVQLRDQLDPGLVTLGEMLQAKGFTTGAAIANSVIYSEGTNFEQGFDSYAGLHGAGDRPSKVVEAAGVVDEALRVLDQRRGLPTFLYVHTMDPHVPYTPPAPFDGKYGPPPTAERPAADPRSDYHQPADRQRLVDQYDGEIAYGDQEFGRFVRELKARGLYERALIVFLADHGEEFQDHGQFTHGKSVFDELVRVPLVVKFPRGRHAGTRAPQQVQGVDVLPTVLEALGLPVPPPPAIAGHPLQAALDGDVPERPVVSEISHRGYVAHGMRTRRDKYVRRFSPDDDELYFDLVQDPRETVNRAEGNRERVRLLRAGVEAAMVPNPFRSHLRVEGGGAYVLRLATGGWIEGVEAVGLGPAEGYTVEGNGRKLELRLQPRPGRPREVAFGVRPMGAPVTLQGTRDGRPLRADEVWIAREAVHPAAVPLTLPELEPVDEDKERLSINVLEPPPAGRAGLSLWLRMVPGRSVMEPFDKETCERFKALGYIATCRG
jgi:arylsulfatase A-like enzyme